jgi:hypothetical protein
MPRLVDILFGIFWIIDDHPLDILGIFDIAAATLDNVFKFNPPGRDTPCGVDDIEDSKERTRI